MFIKNATKESIELAAKKVSAGLMEFRSSGKGFRFRIVPISEKYRKLSASYFNRGRRVHAICWHGHREFFRELFKLSPNAVVVTALARYTAENFESTYRDTDKNVGPLISPIRYSECCNCAENGLA